MLTLQDFYGRVHKRWADELVITSAGRASGAWWAETQSRTSFYLQASMGISSMVSLGLALAVPQARVWNFDGDGALAMNPGALLTEAEAQPPNMIHFVLANRTYAAVRGHPWPGSERLDFVGFARSCGIERVHRFTTTGELDDGLDAVLDERSYAFVVIELEPMDNYPRGEIALDGPELKYAFARHIEERFGVTVFGEGGY